MTKVKKEKNPRICRLASLKGFDGVILGRDIGGILKAGHVYSLEEILDVIIIRDLGKHAVCKWLEKGKISQYATSGVHLLTEEEYDSQLKNEAK